MLTSDHTISFLDIVLNDIKEPIYVLDKEFKVVVWNEAVAELTGVPASQVLGTGIEKIASFKDQGSRGRLQEGKPVADIVAINGIDFRTQITPVFRGEEMAGWRGGLYALDESILRSLPREYLVEVINASPISTIVFNPDGSIMYSNNAYKKMWKLSDSELAFVNQRYNIFLDKQLERQGMMPYVKRAFTGKKHHSPVFTYTLKSSQLGRVENEEPTQMIAHMFPIKNEAGQVMFVVLNFIDVTEQYKLEQAYKISERRLQLAVEGGDLGTWDWDLVTGKVRYNDRWAEMIGYKLDEVYQVTWNNLLHPDDKEEALAKLHKLTSGQEENYEAEFRLKTKSGGWKWVLDRGKVVARTADGKPARVAGTHIDINDRKLGEERLKENEEKYRRLVENAPIGIGIIADEKLMFINQRLADMGGVTNKDMVIGAPAKKFVTEAGYPKFIERYHQVVDKGENAPLYSTQLKSVNGEIIDVEVISIPTKFEGKPAMQVLIHDISEQQKIMSELTRSRELLHQLFENAPMGIVYLNDKFDIININKAFERIFGYTLNELEGKSLVDYIIPAELTEEAEQLNNSALKGEIKYFESYRYSKSGEKIPVLISALPIMENDKPVGIYGIYVDIRQRIKAEEELKTRNLELDNFVYKVSHDLRAPLASILGLINLTKLEGELQEKEYYIDLMEKQVQKLDHFIRDILSHSKNLKMSVTADIIDFAGIINKCFDDLGYLRGSEKVVRKITISGGEFYSDKWRINEIFRNLIGNAIKYRNKEAEQCEVDVTVEVGSGGCTIIVADNGIGISAENLPKVMEMFYRGSDQSEGSGIGLYIVQKAVEKINGTIAIESEPNKGTRFKIGLPSLRDLLKEKNGQNMLPEQ